MFTIAAVIVSIVVALLLIRPLYVEKNDHRKITRDTVNIKIAAALLSELRQSLANADIDEKEFQRYRLELETSVASDLYYHISKATEKRKNNTTIIACCIVLVIPILSITIYQKIGAEEILLATDGQKFFNSPNVVENQLALGKFYTQSGRYPDAIKVYAKLEKLYPEDPEILVNYAETLARVHDDQLSGNPEKLLERVLTIHPDHQRALWLSGLAAMQSGNQTKALTHWRQLLASMETGSEAYQQLNLMINKIGSPTPNDADSSPE